MKKIKIGVMIIMCTLLIVPAMATAPAQTCDTTWGRPCYDKQTGSGMFILNLTAGGNYYSACTQNAAQNEVGSSIMSTPRCPEGEEYYYCHDGVSDTFIRKFEGTCVIVPTPTPTATPEETCVNEGETYMPGDDKQCCAGLEAMTITYGEHPPTCTYPMGYVCTAFCGDGKCEGEYENACSCQEDCIVEADLTCAGQGGEICSSKTPTEICSGSWITASDTSGCCLGDCYIPEDNRCYDSDGGANYYVKGYVETQATNLVKCDNSLGRLYDTCYGDVLREYTCEEDYLPYVHITRIDGITVDVDTTYTCPNGCQDGACLEELKLKTIQTGITVLDSTGEHYSGWTWFYANAVNPDKLHPTDPNRYVVDFTNSYCSWDWQEEVWCGDPSATNYAGPVSLLILRYGDGYGTYPQTEFKTIIDGNEFTIYAPEVTVPGDIDYEPQEPTVLYVATDGSTYYDESLTQLARSATSTPIPTTSPTPSPSPSPTPTFTPAPVVCYDSDGGVNTYVKGTSDCCANIPTPDDPHPICNINRIKDEKGEGVGKDEGDTVWEGACKDGKKIQYLQACPYGCQDSACLSPPTPTPTPPECTLDSQKGYICPDGTETYWCGCADGKYWCGCGGEDWCVISSYTVCSRTTPTPTPTPTPTATAIPTPVVCYDSDGGKNYYTAGETCAGGECKDDQCTIKVSSDTHNHVTSCSGDDCYLFEFACSGSTFWADIYNCPNGCLDGACIGAPAPTPTATAIPTPVVCYDSDGGRSYYEKGTAKGVNTEGTDFCGVRTVPEYSGPIRVDSCEKMGWKSGKQCTLYEWSCESGPEFGDNHAVRWEYECTYGCEDGSCISAPTMPENKAPVAVVMPDKTYAYDGDFITLDGFSSYDPDGYIVKYHWTGPCLDVIRMSPMLTIDTGDPYTCFGSGKHKVTLTVTDDLGGTASDTTIIKIEYPETEAVPATKPPTPVLVPTIQPVAINIVSAPSGWITGGTRTFSISVKNPGVVEPGKEFKVAVKGAFFDPASINIKKDYAFTFKLYESYKFVAEKNISVTKPEGESYVSIPLFGWTATAPDEEGVHEYKVAGKVSGYKAEVIFYVGIFNSTGYISDATGSFRPMESIEMLPSFEIFDPIRMITKNVSAPTPSPAPPRLMWKYINISNKGSAVMIEAEAITQSGSIHKITVTQDPEKKKLVLVSNGVRFETDTNIKLKEDGIYIKIGDVEKEIEILPDVASETAKEKARFHSVKKIELKSAAGKPMYRIEGARQGRLFYIIPVIMDITVEIDASTGDVIGVDEPWWSMIAPPEAVATSR